MDYFAQSGLLQPFFGPTVTVVPDGAEFHSACGTLQALSVNRVQVYAIGLLLVAG